MLCTRLSAHTHTHTYEGKHAATFCRPDSVWAFARLGKESGTHLHAGDRRSLSALVSVVTVRMMLSIDADDEKGKSREESLEDPTHTAFVETVCR